MSEDSSNNFAIWVGGTICAAVGLAVILYFLRKYIQGGQFTKPVRIDGKVVIITGCNTGLGKETVLDLAARGAHIHMACRDKVKCEEAKNEIIEKTGNTNIFNRELDLASLDSIRSFARKFIEEEKRLDILINNAGVMAIPKSLTKDGFEMQIGVNHMGHFLLTNLLLDMLKASSPSRIINLSSIAHQWFYMNKDDLNSDKSYSKYQAYSQSKLANVLFTKSLAKRLEGTGVTVNAVHPGIVRTNLGRYLSYSFVRKVLRPATSFFFKTPKSGAQTTLAVALDPELEKVTGKYFSDCKIKKEAAAARDDNLAEWLWKTSDEWTKLSASTSPV
ncbi:retinol dehydrogenase 12-like isoform X1 [Bradysia coprophila]|uniref:retinol dehydrogenase 12-like isoform X1 n=1 Tax=Bradysia coprophila TaxID=38358 RepID=UPI00187D9E29|nr:retinol dehydrogenase 12-like isoform X1 [Bradysia coprophila]XP_037043903.1 retinol dehydrogenase 12-like isoform X1 [Bradysia coprophila]